MLTALAKTDRDALLARVRSLEPQSAPVAGTLTAPPMLCHIADQLAVALGDITGGHRETLVMRTLAKWLILYVPIRIPFGKVATVPEMLTTEPSNWVGDVARFEVLVSRLVNADHVARHPVFGQLTHSEWGILTAKHIDHHLRQFRV